MRPKCINNIILSKFQIFHNRFEELGWNKINTSEFSFFYLNQTHSTNCKVYIHMCPMYGMFSGFGYNCLSWFTTQLGLNSLLSWAGPPAATFF